uniref:ATP synthase complex subunit 8 n=1 Tax=Lytta caraganae TaxID=1850555 RepID=A0A1L2DYD5_9CUCU|nr:ATP synthase F0 subunit 8 [Lytta caraganae]ANG08414.1 ATP synthase F0 subunit 8 [Lytta caraganae]APB02807.1 ATP synthase F0 subunit 8 [Lytta caraganae]
MPQMAPLNWLSLLIYFILIFLLTNSINFYSFLYHSKATSMGKKSQIELNWKWL